MRDITCSTLKVSVFGTIAHDHTSKALLVNSVPIHPRMLRSASLLFWWSTSTIQQLKVWASPIWSSTTVVACVPSLMSVMRSFTPSTITRFGFSSSMATDSSSRRFCQPMPRTLKTKNRSFTPSPYSASGIIRLTRICWVLCALCSVSYHNTLMGSSRMRSNPSTFFLRQQAMTIERKSVFPLFALPVLATSSESGKHSVPFILNRNCMGASSVSGVTLYSISSSWGVSFFVTFWDAVWLCLDKLSLTSLKLSSLIIFMRFL